MLQIDITGKLYPKKFYYDHSVDRKGIVHEDNSPKLDGRKIVKQTIDPEVIKLFEQTSEELLKLSRRQLLKHTNPDNCESDEAVIKKITFFIYNAKVFQTLTHSQADLHLYTLGRNRDLLKLPNQPKEKVVKKQSEEVLLSKDSKEVKPPSEVVVEEPMLDFGWNLDLNSHAKPYERELNAKLMLLKPPSDLRTLLRVNCGDDGVLELDKNHLKKMSFMNSMFDDLVDIVQIEEMPLPGNINRYQLGKAYLFAANEEILETDVNLLIQDYIASSFLQFETYEKALHEKIIQLSPTFLTKVAEVDFRLFERSINRSFKQKVDSNNKMKILSHLQREIFKETDPERKGQLIQIFKVYVERLRFFGFDSINEFVDSTKNGGEDIKELLNVIDLSKCRIRKNEFSEVINILKKFPNLEEVNFPYGIIQDDYLELIKQLKSLKRLDLSQCRVSDAGLAHLSEMTQLTHLNLSKLENITDAGLAHLSGMTKMTHLDLFGLIRITNAGLAHLSGMTQMTHLTLSGLRQVTDAGLAHLSGMTQMLYLDLSWLRLVTDAGVARLKVVLHDVVINKDTG